MNPTAADANGEGADAAFDLTRRRLAALLLGSPWGAALGAASPPSLLAPDDGAAHTGRWAHAFAAYGAPKYGPDFKHFEYVNPDAPKGGEIRLRYPDRRTSFDKYNPWTTRGNAPAGVLIWMVEGLCHMSQDEPSTMYGLVAEAILVAPDYGSVSFRLNPKARFWNGDAVTPADVVHSLTMLASQGASPAYQNVVAGLDKAVIVDERTVRIELKDKSRDQVFIAGTLPIFSRKWGAGKPFDQVTQEYPITTGAYVIDKVEVPRRIEFKLNPEYWARDLPVRRGHFNFGRVVYRAYQDHSVAREGFKAGEFHIIREYGGRSYLRVHAGPKWDDGRIIKNPMPVAIGKGLQSYHFNNRRPKFQDIRVREAIALAYDFDTGNRTKIYKRAYSVFNNSEFAAEGLPSAGELALLEPFRAEVPATVFGPAYRPLSTGADPRKQRQMLLRARDLLEQAGHKVGADGVLRNAKGETLEFEYLTPREGGVEDWQHNLTKLGITLKERVVDFALYRRRLEKFDFEVITIVEGDFTLPAAAELKVLYGSKAADEEGNNNFRGIKSRAVDAMLVAIERAQTMEQLRDAAHALDRVVMWNHWQVPDLYGDSENISYWNRFGIPKVQAKYFATDILINGFNDFGPWPLWCWWDASVRAQPAGAPVKTAPRA